MKYKGWHIQYNADDTYTAINPSDIHDYYIRPSLTACYAVIDERAVNLDWD